MTIRNSCTPSIYSAYAKCDCGGSYIREPHPHHALLCPYCEDCGEIAATFMVRKKYGRSTYDIRYTKQGNQIRSFEEAIEIGVEVDREVKRKTFSPDSYRKNAAGTIAETIESFINRVVLKQFPDRDLDPDYRYLKEHLAPHFVEVGIFAACEVHLQMYFWQKRILKKDQREYVRRLWNKVLDTARPAWEVA